MKNNNICSLLLKILNTFLELKQKSVWIVFLKVYKLFLGIKQGKNEGASP